MKKNWLLRIILGIAGVLVVAVVAVLIWQKGYYGGRWYGGTTINGVDVSKQTLAQSKQKLIDALDQGEYVTVTGRSRREMAAA